MCPFDRSAYVRHTIARVVGNLCPNVSLRYVLGLCSLVEFEVEDPNFPQFAVFDGNHYSDLVLSSNSQS